MVDPTFSRGGRSGSVYCGRALAIKLSRLITIMFLSCTFLGAQGAETNSEGTPKYGDVDISGLRNADRNPEQWAAMGRTLNGGYSLALSGYQAALAAQRELG
jgi:hypothetical protein